MTETAQGRFAPSIPLGTAIFRSWKSIKTPVMVWLWYLNALYWVGFAYLAREEAFWVIVSYFAVAPIVTVIAITQRGLTRLSGLIHLPWVPLIVYLGLRLFTDELGPPLTAAEDGFYYWWLQVTLWSTVICVALDIMDVFRWFAGQRYVLGTPQAADAGASKLAQQTP